MKLTGNNNGLEASVIVAIYEQLDEGRPIRSVAIDLEVAKNTVSKYKGLRDFILHKYAPDHVIQKETE